jgi:hypothetical protein
MKAKKGRGGLGVVEHNYNPKYQEADTGVLQLEASPDKTSVRPYLKNKLKAKGLERGLRGGVCEFSPQHITTTTTTTTTTTNTNDNNNKQRRTEEDKRDLTTTKHNL